MKPLSNSTHHRLWVHSFRDWSVQQAWNAAAKKPADFLKSVLVRNESGDDSKCSVDKGKLDANCDFGTTPGQNKELSFELLDMPKGYRILSGSTAKLSADKDQYHDIVIGVDLSESGVAKVDARVLDGCADIAVYVAIALGMIVLVVFIFGRRKVSDADPK